ncbi:hypothetical protein ACJX0J_021175, partial [Zea mays]
KKKLSGFLNVNNLSIYLYYLHSFIRKKTQLNILVDCIIVGDATYGRVCFWIPHVIFFTHEGASLFTEFLLFLQSLISSRETRDRVAPLFLLLYPLSIGHDCVLAQDLQMEIGNCNRYLFPSIDEGTSVVFSYHFANSFLNEAQQ